MYVRPAATPCVTRRYPHFFHCHVATILVFSQQTLWQYSDEEPLTGASYARQNRDCRPISRFVSEMMPVRAIVTMEGEY